MPEYCYPDDDIPVGGNMEWNGGDLGFYGENINYQKNSQISERLEKYKLEYQIIFYQYQVMNLKWFDLSYVLKEKELGKFSIGIMKMNGMKKIILMNLVYKCLKVKFQNIYLIGKNLYDCFSRMIPV